MKTLSYDEFRRVHKTLYRRIPETAVKDIRAIGFGPAIRNGKYDSTRPISACVYVDQKRKNVRGDRKIKSVISVRVKRGRNYHNILVPIDIRDTLRLVPSGKFVSAIDGQWLGSAGALIAWQLSGSTWNWGVVTGSHFTKSLDLGDTVELQVVQGSAPNLPATLLARSATTELLDSCLLRVHETDLRRLNIVTQMNPPTVGQFWSETDIAKRLLQSRDGNSLWPFPGANKFQTGTFFHESDDLVPDLGNLSNVFLVTGDGSSLDPFMKGTSGTAWQVEGTMAAIQVAHDPQHPQIGLAQVLDTQLIWVKQQIRQLFHTTVRNLRFVRPL